jgi:phosphoribosyl-ATP pyrophosphohydrolase / phosphoribosyl-AMP cyclohydrolase / histidinol dehydrogenase
LIKASSVTQAVEFQRRNFRLLDVVYVDATAIDEPGDIVDILDAGAAKAFITLEQLAALSREQNVCSSRLVTWVSSDQEVDALKSWIAEERERRDIGICTNSVSLTGLAAKLGIDASASEIYKSYADATESILKECLAQGVVAVVPSDALTLEKEDGSRISAVRILTAGAITDQNIGLYATSVTGERGTSLGLVWSSYKSIAEALRTGSGVTRVESVACGTRANLVAMFKCW